MSRFRLPTSRDLARAAHEGDSRLAMVRLVESCQIATGEEVEWGDEEIEEIGEAMASADPLAEIRIELNCSECGYRWDEALDLVSFLWIEIEARAKRLLRDVHALASAYGWSEREILSLSEPRRQLYLEMARE